MTLVQKASENTVEEVPICIKNTAAAGGWGSLPFSLLASPLSTAHWWIVSSHSQETWFRSMILPFQKSASTTGLRFTVKQLYFQPLFFFFSCKLLHFTLKSKTAVTIARKNYSVCGGFYLGVFSKDCAFNDCFMNECQASALRFRNTRLR